MATNHEPTIRACRVCGCTDNNACVNLNDDTPCHWTGEDLCSFCDPRRTRPPRTLAPTTEQLTN